MLINQSKSQQNHYKYQLPFVVFLAIIALCIWTLLRLVLWIDVGPAQLTAGQTLKMLSRGVWFDINTLSYLILPLVLVGLLLPNRWRDQQWLTHLKWLFAGIVTFSLLFGVVAEFIF